MPWPMSPNNSRILAVSVALVSNGKILILLVINIAVPLPAATDDEFPTRKRSKHAFRLDCLSPESKEFDDLEPPCV